MPKSHFDWFTVATLWLAALILAIKTGDVPLMHGAPLVLASPLWGYVPFALVCLYGCVTLYRQSRVSLRSQSSVVPADSVHAALPAGATASRTTADHPLDPNILPSTTAAAYLSLALSDPTQLQLRKFMSPYLGKWIELTLTLATLSNDSENHLRAQMRHAVGDKRSDAIWAYFDDKWEDHLQHIKRGELIRFRGKVHLPKAGDPEFIDAIPLLD